MKVKANRASKSPLPDNMRAGSETLEQLHDATPFDTRSTPSDEGVWVDEPDNNLARSNEKFPSPSLSASTRAAGVRKRKGGKTIFVAQPNPSKRYPASRIRNIKEDEPPLINIDRERLRGAVRDGASYTIEYAFDVVKTSLHLLRKPLSLLLFLYILSALFSQVGNAFRTVLSPVCWIPGISRTPLCYSPSSAPKVTKWADYPKLVEVQGSRFEQLLDESVGNSGISLDIKRAEMATSDLIALVKVSDFKAKDTLAMHLEGFVVDAKKTGRGLQRLSSRIGGAVDNIIAVNDYALNTIEENKDKTKSALSVLWPFSKSVAVQEVLRETFVDAMSVLETQMRRIVLEAEISLRDLADLEERLRTLHEFVARENSTLSEAHKEVMGELWTFFGANKKKLRHMNKHLFLLSNIGEYRRRATAQVSAALQTLEGMSEDMEDLRQRVAAPELMGERIPVEVHMKSIRAGLERLQADRNRSKAREQEAMRRMLGIDDGEDED